MKREMFRFDLQTLGFFTKNATFIAESVPRHYNKDEGIGPSFWRKIQVDDDGFCEALRTLSSVAGRS